MDNSNLGYPIQQPNPYMYAQPRQVPQQQAYAAPMPQQGYPVMPQPKISEFVQGELGATIFPINYPNQEAYLIDTDNPEIIYRKGRDANGKLTPIVKYRLTPIEDKKEEIDMKEYVKSDELLDLVSDLVQNEVEKRLSEISFKPSSEDKKERK